MDMMQLEMFVATAELRSVQRASERVFRTQPAVSMAIRKLEEELGALLFDRASRGNYQLTAAGEVLFAYAQRLLGLRDEALTHVKELQSLEDGRVRIGANESTGNYLLPRLIHAFRKKYPKIRIDVTRQNSRQLIHDLRDNMVDLALISFAPDEKDIEAVPIMKDELVLIASPDHPLAKKGKTPLHELGTESFIAHTVTSQSRQKVVEAFRSSETPLRIVMEVAMIETIKKLVAAGLGLAFVPEMSVQDEIQHGELTKVTVEGFQYERTLYLARRRSQAHSHAAREFAETVFASRKTASD
ncbi:MAG TPA: LysR family transcriptional regulator [Terriglobia bacterium]|nr:LysR family transcriptional regulator [Terriglobia bacterium]